MSLLPYTRIGDTLSRTYRFYHPVAGTGVDGVKAVADRTNPVDLTGITITWVLQINGESFSYSTTVTPLTGEVDVLITDEETAVYSKDLYAVSFLSFEYADGSVKSKAQRRESVMPREEVVL